MPRYQNSLDIAVQGLRSKALPPAAVQLRSLGLLFGICAARVLDRPKIRTSFPLQDNAHSHVLSASPADALELYKVVGGGLPQLSQR